MHESDRRDAPEHDADAPLARSAFARQLGDEWQPEEPGIYRYVGPARSGSASGLDGRGAETKGMQPGRRWLPWRRH